MEGFTPFSAIVGGALIGLSASFLWIANGRIAGISGIVGGVLAPVRGEMAWRATFLVGLLAEELAQQMDGDVDADQPQHGGRQVDGPLARSAPAGKAALVIVVEWHAPFPSGQVGQVSSSAAISWDRPGRGRAGAA